MTSRNKMRSHNNSDISLEIPDTVNELGIMTRSQLKRLSVGQGKQLASPCQRNQGQYTSDDELLSPNTRQSPNKSKQSVKSGKDSKDQNTKQTPTQARESVRSRKDVEERKFLDESSSVGTSQTRSKTKHEQIMDQASSIKLSSANKTSRLSRKIQIESETSRRSLIQSLPAKNLQVTDTHSTGEYVKTPNNPSLVSSKNKNKNSKRKLRSPNKNSCQKIDTSVNPDKQITCESYGDIENETDVEYRINTSLKQDVVSERNSSKPLSFMCNADLVCAEEDVNSSNKHGDKNELTLSRKLLFDDTPHMNNSEQKSRKDAKMKNKQLIILVEPLSDYKGECKHLGDNDLLEKRDNKLTSKKTQSNSMSSKATFVEVSEHMEENEMYETVNISSKKLKKTSPKVIEPAVLNYDVSEENENTDRLSKAIHREEHTKQGSSAKKNPKSPKAIESVILAKNKYTDPKVEHRSKSKEYVPLNNKLGSEKEVLPGMLSELSELNNTKTGMCKAKKFTSVSLSKSSSPNPIRKSIETVECLVSSVKRKKQDKSVKCDVQRSNLLSQNKVLTNDVHSKSVRQSETIDIISEVVDHGCSKVGSFIVFDDGSERSIEKKANLAITAVGQSDLYAIESNEKSEKKINSKISSVNECNMLKHEQPVSKSNSCSLNMKPENLTENFQDSDSDAESRKAIMKSAQKRIEQSLSTSESDSKHLLRTSHKSVPMEGQDESSDSESAPDDMTFDAGRKVAMESLRNAVESIQREKQRKKARRKERLEKLKQQKEEKLIRLKERLASQEDASCSSSEESGYEEESLEASAKRSKLKVTVKNKSVKTEKENVKKDFKCSGKITHFGDVEADDSTVQKVPAVAGLKRLPADILERLPDQLPTKLQKVVSVDEKPKKKKKDKNEAVTNDIEVSTFKTPSNLDYIPLKSSAATRFGVVALEMTTRAPKSIVHKAVDFRQNMLFGSRIVREPAKNLISFQQKRKTSTKDRFVR